MPDFAALDIREIFYFALRLLAAAGGFLAGWFLAAPLALVLVRLAFHRTLPASARFVTKLTGGLVLGVLVFLYLPLGLGGGGGGRGGGTGKGTGPGTDFNGSSSTQTGKGDGKAKGGPVTTEPGKLTKGILVIELLGGDAVKDGKYYLLDRKGPPVDAATLQKNLEQRKLTLAAVHIVLTEDSVGESHLAVRQCEQLAQDCGLPSLIVRPGKAMDKSP